MLILLNVWFLFIQIQKGKYMLMRLSMLKYKIKKKTGANQIGWIAPPIGWLKVNVDGSFVQDTGKGATGAVIRDQQGHVVAASGNILASCNSAEETEARALIDGAKLASEWSNSPIIFESDCANVVKEHQKGQESAAHLRSIYSDFAVAVAVFPRWKCVLARRAQNYFAHECAAYVRHLGVRCVWKNFSPDHIAEAMV
jgi:ribonuclease HI